MFFKKKKFDSSRVGEIIRPCPLCKGTASDYAFPFFIKFESQLFGHYRCGNCASVYVNPLPHEKIFANMYTKSEYHDFHYSEFNVSEYEKAAGLLKTFTNNDASVLDYGCGFGYFLNALKSLDFSPKGVEFDPEAAKFARKYTDCDVVTVKDFFTKSKFTLFDVIHLGDVLEHLPNPTNTIKCLLKYLKPGGLLYVEGPLEINPSPVYWASLLYGTFKHLLLSNYVGKDKPLHLFRTGARQQLAFFNNVELSLVLRHWRVYETGWPYAEGGLVKRVIAFIGKVLSGISIFRLTFGNRFSGIFEYNPKKVVIKS